MIELLICGMYSATTTVLLKHQKYILVCITNIKIHSECEIEDFVETHLCKLCVMLRSRVLLGVCPH